MKKKLLTILGISLISSSLFGTETNNTEVNTSNLEVKKENNGKGFYIGGGVGGSFYGVGLTDGAYYLKDDTDTVEYTINGDDLDGLSDTDLGYNLYVGYLFNKIIGVESSYTDYGYFSGNVNKEDIGGNVTNEKFTKKPRALSVYANAGYTFLNGQLRPFGLLGLGYMKTDQSDTYKQFEFQDDFMTMHYGVGVDYYPTALNGFGVRASFVGDSYADYSVESREGAKGTALKTTTLWQYYSLLYVSAQYKF